MPWRWRSRCASHFNPRSPCGERRHTMTVSSTGLVFQSTLPVWGATAGNTPFLKNSLFQSTLPVWGATEIRRLYMVGILFQSTLPVWGATGFHGSIRCISPHFNPRSPCGERRSRLREPCRIGRISIHAPRVGSDPRLRGWPRVSLYFNPRSPCGERRGSCARWSPSRGYFNPRSPCGERLGELVGGAAVLGISIHAPRVGSDLQG